MKAQIPLRMVFAVAIYVLPKQRHLAVALINEEAALGHDIVGRPRDLRTTCVGDDAVGAVLVAAADDRDAGRDGVIPLGSLIIELAVKRIVGPDDAGPRGKNLIEDLIEAVDIVGS